MVARGKGLEPFQVTAKAEVTAIGIGGWLPLRSNSGQLDKSISPWFSFTVSETEALAAFYRGGPFRTTGSLEALVALVGRLFSEITTNQELTQRSLCQGSETTAAAGTHYQDCN